MGMSIEERKDYLRDYNRVYFKTEVGRAAQLRYRQTEKGRKANKRGCLQFRKSDKGKEYLRTKYREYCRQYGQTFSGRYGLYKRGAKYQGLEFTLNKEDFASFWQVPCYYCGTIPATIGLDRIDNAIGYIKANIVSCCKACNRMKSNSPQKEFIEQCAKIAALRGGVPSEKKQ